MKRITVFLLNLIVLFGIAGLYSQMSHAQQLKIGKNLNNLKPSVLLDLEDASQALLLTRVKDPNRVIARNAYRGMIVFDSAVNKLTYYDGISWVYPVATDTNLYQYDGVLVGNRRVGLNGKSLSFANGTTDSLYLIGGKVGISTHPISALQVKGAMRADSLVLENLPISYQRINSLGIDSVGNINIISQLSPSNVFVQGIKNSGGNAFGDTGRLGTYDAYPLRLYAGSLPGVTIKSSGIMAGYAPIDTATIYLRNVAYNGSTPVALYPNPKRAGIDGVSIQASSPNPPDVTYNLLDNKTTTDTKIYFSLSTGAICVGGCSAGFRIPLNALYYIDSVVLVSPGTAGSTVGLDIARVRITGGTSTYDQPLVGASGLAPYTPFGMKTGSTLGNALTVYFSPNANFWYFNLSEVKIYGRRAKAVYSGTTETRVNGRFAMDNVGRGTSMDSLLTINTATGEVRRVAPATIKPDTDTNIYNFDGTLKGNRTVTMNNKTLYFMNGNLQTDNLQVRNNLAVLSGAIINNLLVSNNFFLNSVLPIGDINKDEILVVDTTVRRQVKKIPASSFKTIYNADGTLTSNRIVTMNNKNLSFTNGNIGIGTTMPTQLLSIGNPILLGSPIPAAITLGGTFSSVAGTNLKLRLVENGTEVWGFGVSNNQLDYAVPTNSSHVFYVGGTERMRIATGNAGNVGIGTSTPYTKLDVLGNIYLTNHSNNNLHATTERSTRRIGQKAGTSDDGFNGLEFEVLASPVSGIDNAGIIKFFTWGSSISFNREVARIDPYGNIGINTMNPTEKLEVIGNIKSSATIFATRLQGISDERLKENISPIKGALNKILQLQGVTYTWRKDIEKQAGYAFKTGIDYGVIAQNIQKILPELVQQDSKGYLTVDYVHITPILIESVKELKQEIEELKQLLRQQLNKK